MSNANSYDSTSERVSEDEYQAREGEYLIYLFHVATYDFARTFVEGRRVLDFGCGTGYGTHRIADACASITGVDVSGAAIDFARERYVADNVEFRQIVAVDDAALPFPDNSFDVVLSFQVIEHVPDANRYLAEARRVLTEHGVLIVATPDRTSRLLRRQRPWNRYHLVEYAPDELVELLGSHFSDVELNTMSGDPEIIGRELKRSRQLRWLTLPFTFPGSPERWRQAGLRTLKAVMLRVRPDPDASGPASGAAEGAAGGAGEVPAAGKYGYDASSIHVAPGVSPSVNLVAVARVAPARV